MHDGPFKDAAAYFKTTKEGRKEMIGTLQDYLEELAEEIADERFEGLAKTRAEELQKAQAYAIIKAFRLAG